MKTPRGRSIEPGVELNIYARLARPGSFGASFASNKEAPYHVAKVGSVSYRDTSLPSKPDCKNHHHFDPLKNP